MSDMKIGIMQPYFLPYIGYWQLMNAVDRYVIYDDVAYIKQGWINRNRMLLNGKEFLFSIPLAGASSFKNINEIAIALVKSRLLKTIAQGYAKAPFYDTVFPLIGDIINYEEQNLARYVTHSIRAVADYLGIKTELVLSSEIDKDSSLRAQDKVLDMCQTLGATEYFNAIGGQQLYSREEFLSAGIALRFLKTNPIVYQQFNNKFVPLLSILDVMMFNSVENISAMLVNYELV